MDGIARLYMSAMVGEPNAMAICEWWVDNYGCLPDGSTDTREDIISSPRMVLIFPPK